MNSEVRIAKSPPVFHTLSVVFEKIPSMSLPSAGVLVHNYAQCVFDNRTANSWNSAHMSLHVKYPKVSDKVIRILILMHLQIHRDI